MRKHKITLAAGIAASLLMAAGCSGQASTSASSAAASESQTENKTETSGNQAEKETENQAQSESGNEVSEEKSDKESDPKDAEFLEEPGLADLTLPLKVWGTITEVSESTMTVDNQSENSSTGEMIFNIDPEGTLVLDAVTGFPVGLKDVQLGDFEAYLGPAMTMSLPPQTTPYVVIVNLVEDAAVPQYVISAGAVEEKDGSRVLHTKDGAEYTLAEEVEILPYLTRNIVTLEDIEEDSKCLLWMNTDGMVEKIVLFAD